MIAVPWWTREVSSFSTLLMRALARILLILSGELPEMFKDSVESVSSRYLDVLNIAFWPPKKCTKV